MTTLAQTRNMTMADAVATMETLAHVACRLALADAKREKRLADVESTHKESVAADRQEYDLLEQRLKEYCRSNPGQFQTPRTIKTPFGEFGCRRVSDVHVDDETLLVQALLDRGYADAVKVSHRPIKPAIRERLEAGEVLPGCELRIAENDPVVKINSALLRAAVEEA
jgi:hypothetical protein